MICRKIDRNVFKFVHKNAMMFKRLTWYVSIVTPSIALAKSPVLVLYLNNETQTRTVSRARWSAKKCGICCFSFHTLFHSG